MRRERSGVYIPPHGLLLVLVDPPLPLDAHGQVLGHEPSLNGLNADCLQVGGKGSQLGIV